MKKLLTFFFCMALICACTEKVDTPKNDVPPPGSLEETEKPEDNTQNGNGQEGSETPDLPPASGAPMTVRFMSYNVGVFSKDKATLGHYSYPEVAAIFKEFNVGIAGLNETDNNRKRTEYQYQAKELAKVLGTGWTYAFFDAIDGNYGNSIVASPDYKVVKEWNKVTIQKLDGSETRSMGAIEYEDFVFCVTHLDHKSLNARLNGVKTVTDWAKKNYGEGKTTKPVILLGDMNCIPSEETITEFKKDWDLVSTTKEYTFNTNNPSKCIDFIFVLKNGAVYTKGESHAIQIAKTADVKSASDHFPMYVDLTFNAQK